MIELWKTLEKFPDYEVSNTGIVRVKVGVDKKLFTYKSMRDHIVCILTNKEGIRKAFAPHQLVASLYLPKVDGLDDVMHIDFNEYNNAVDNLKWCEAKSRDITYPILSDTIKEEWRVIIGFTNYSVSNLGRVKNNITGKLRKVNMNYGYNNVNLYTNDHKESHMKVHRLVATAFLPNEKVDGKDFVNHIDGNKYNNRSDNLEWVTSKENRQHAMNTDLIDDKGENNGNAVTTDEEVTGICKDLELDTLTNREIAKKHGVLISTVYNVLYRVRWIHISKDYKFSPKHTKDKIKDQKMHKVCGLLEDTRNSFSQIAKACGISYATVQRTYKGNSHKDISKDYNFPVREASVVTGNDTILKIVKLFQEDPSISDNTIGKMFKLDGGTIGRIRNRRTHNKITKDMIW